MGRLQHLLNPLSGYGTSERWNKMVCEETYQIVTTMRAEIMENRISNESPAGKALLGKKIGDEVIVDAPAGELKFKILEIGNN